MLDWGSQDPLRSSYSLSTSPLGRTQQLALEVFNKQTQQGSARAAPRPPKPGVKSASDVLGPPRSGLCDGEAEPSATSLGLSGGSQSQRGAAKQGVKGLCPSVPGPAVSPAEEGWEEGLRFHASTTTRLLDPAGPSARLSEAGAVSPTRERVEANPRVQTKGGSLSQSLVPEQRGKF